MAKLTVSKPEDRFPDMSAEADLQLRASLRVVGIQAAIRPYYPILERNYVKFNSDSGVSDALQGRQFESWLKRKKLKYNKSSERSFLLSARATKVVEKLWEKCDLEVERSKIDAKLKKLKAELKTL